MNKCKNCKSLNIHIEAIEGSQYLRACCQKCGKTGRESLYFKDCGMEEMTDSEIAVENWNNENEQTYRS